MFHAGGFVRTEPNLDRPDIQFILLPANYTPKGVGKAQRASSPSAGIGHGYGLMTVLLRRSGLGLIASPIPVRPRSSISASSIGMKTSKRCCVESG
jgi:hypothetical protein